MSEIEFVRPSRKAMMQALLPFVTPDTRKGLTIFIREYLTFLVGMALALFTDHLALRLAGALLAGLKMNSLYTLGHDAGHQSLTGNRTLNRWLATLAYLPSLFNWRLWHYDHQQIHHAKTNGPQVDVYRPMSLDEYRAAPWWRKAWERLVRSCNPVGFALYILYHSRIEQAKVFPHVGEHPEAVRHKAWPHSLLIVFYAASLLGWFWWRNDGLVSGFALDFLFAVAIPFFVMMNGIALGVYIQHTHPSIPWFKDTDSTRELFDQAALTVNFHMPAKADKLSHNVMAHQVHHVLPSIPSYRLREAQNHLVSMLNGTCIESRPGNLLDTFRRCKLYDFENRRWLDFDGRPTTEPVPLPTGAA